MTTACAFPEKDRLTKAEAKERAVALSHKPGARPVFAYRCPAGRHFHVGHRYGPKRKRW